MMREHSLSIAATARRFNCYDHRCRQQRHQRSYAETAGHMDASGYGSMSREELGPGARFECRSVDAGDVLHADRLSEAIRAAGQESEPEPFK